MGALIALILALFWPAAILRRFLMFGDILFFFEPAKSLLHESLRSGRLPLWSPWIFCGYPVAAEGQIAAFYPLSLLISWLLPSPAASNWLVISHLLIAAVSMYALARLLGVSLFAAWLAAIVYAFSGFLFAHIHHVSLLCAAAWLPLVVFFVERAWRGAVTPNAVLAALAWGLAALCGHPQMLFFISLVAIFWVGWRWLESRRERGRAITIVSIVFGLGLALGAVQLLLTAQLALLAPHGEKGELSYITSFSLLPKHLFGLLSPNWEGTPAFSSYQGDPYYWEYVLYIGLIPLGLALIGATRRRGRALTILAIVALALAMAAVNPLYALLRYLPGFSDFRAPARYAVIFTFAAALLAAFGWDELSKLGWLRRGRRLVVFGAVVAALSAFDLLWFDRTLAPLAGPSVVAPSNRVAEALKGDKGWWRAMIVPPVRIGADWTPKGGGYVNPDGWSKARSMLPADVAQSYRIHVADGYAGFKDRDQSLFFSAAYAAAQMGDLRPLSLVGIKYLALPPQAQLPGLASVRVDPFVIFRNPEAFPRAFTVPQTIIARDPQEAHEETIKLAQAGRLKEAAVTMGAAPAISSSPGAPAELSLSEPRPERIVVTAKSERDCLLVLNERYDPGWRVQVDGRPGSLVSVDVVLMGTPLPKGEHRVEFLYQPRAFIVGRLLTLVALAISVALLCLPALWRTGTREEHPAERTARR